MQAPEKTFSGVETGIFTFFFGFLHFFFNFTFFSFYVYFCAKENRHLLYICRAFSQVSKPYSMSGELLSIICKSSDSKAEV